MQSEPQKILVVDDDLDILEFLHELLEMEGYAAVVTDKVEYLEQLQDDTFPNLILLDVLLSGKDGRDVVKDLKSRKETRSIPVIMFSAHPSAEKAALAAGADDFVAKPFEIDELLEKIARYIR